MAYDLLEYVNSRTSYLKVILLTLGALLLLKILMVTEKHLDNELPKSLSTILVEERVEIDVLELL